MRVLQLLASLTGGGAERQATYLSQGLIDRGHDVLLAASRGAGRPPAVPVHVLPLRHAWNPWQIVDAVRLIRAWKPDLVQSSSILTDVVGGLACAIARVPFVVREPNSPEAYGTDLRSRLRALVARRCASAVISISQEGGGYWARVAPKLPRAVIRNGVPIDAIEAAAPAVREGRAAVGVSVARLVPEKNVDVVLRACAAVMRERDLLLGICGQGPQRAPLEALARELGIDARVRFRGFVDDVWSYERGADFGLLLSRFEGNPNAISEAFAAGTPMILSDIPAHREMAGPDEALFVPPGDAAAAANAIRDVLDDRPSALARAGRAKARVREFSIAKMAARYEATYGDVLASS